MSHNYIGVTSSSIYHFHQNMPYYHGKIIVCDVAYVNKHFNRPVGKNDIVEIHYAKMKLG